MKDNGRMIYNMGREWRCGTMELSILEITSKGKSRVKENMNGQMDPFMKVNGRTIKLKDRENIVGQMEEDTLDYG